MPRILATTPVILLLDRKQSDRLARAVDGDADSSKGTAPFVMMRERQQSKRAELASRVDLLGIIHQPPDNILEVGCFGPSKRCANLSRLPTGSIVPSVLESPNSILALAFARPTYGNRIQCFVTASRNGFQ